jgi:hypothetical protein
LKVLKEVPAHLLRAPIVRRGTLSVKARAHACVTEADTLFARLVMSLSEGLRLLEVGKGGYLRLRSVLNYVLDYHWLDFLVHSLLV